MPFGQFLAMFNRFNVAAWPAQIVWYVAAAAIVGLTLWPRRGSTQIISFLAATYVAWTGIAFFAVYDNQMNLALLWAGVFMLEAVLLLVAGLVRTELVIRLRRDASFMVGTVFIGYALVAYPIIGLVGGHSLSTLPTFGLAPCPTVIFLLGMLLLARPPAPTYLVAIPLAWAFTAAPPNLAMGNVPDFVLLLVAVATAWFIIWRDCSSTAQIVTACLLLTVMVALSGHDNLQIGFALVLIGLTLGRHTVITTFPRALPSSRYRRASGTPLNG
jgi:hypothetical protein